MSLTMRMKDRARLVVERGLQELHHAIRLLYRSPGFTATAVLTLALGIGANTAVFSVVDAVLLRPLAYAEPERLVALQDAVRSQRRGGIATGNLAHYRSARAFAGLAGYNRGSMALTKSGTPEQVLGEAVTWNLLDVLGVAPAIGRTFRPDEEGPGASGVVILTHGFWQRRFDADPAILGRTLILNDEPHVVIGVLPDGFEPLSQRGSGFTIDFLTPAAYRAPQVGAVARLAPGVSIEQARAEMQSISADLAARLPETHREVRAIVTPLHERYLRDEVRLSLVVMLVAVGLVLVIACVNLGNLLLVRAIGQQREIATRLALGATRGQVAFGLAIRGLVLGALGGAAGLAGGVWIRAILVALAPPTIPGLDRLALTPRVLAVTVGLSLGAGVAAGLLPAIQLRLEGAATALRAGERGTSASRSVARWRGVLMSTQIAAALMLTIAAALLVQSLIRLNSVELGFRTDGVLMFTVRLPDTRYPDQSARLRFFERLGERVGAIAGVQSVAITDALPMRGGGRIPVAVAGEPTGGGRTDVQIVNPGYFATLGIQLHRGRLLGTGDRTGSEPVVVVSDAFVRRFLPHGDPIGRRIQLDVSKDEATVVGVVADVRRGGRHTAVTPQVFLPAAQTALYADPLAEVGVRAAGDPLALVPEIRRAIAAIDPDQPITHVQAYDDVAAGWAAGRRFNMTLLGALAALAVSLALVGVYGVVSHAAVQRTGEIGIRIALGAHRGHVIALILTSTVRWASGGIAAGVVGAYVTTGVMAGLLFGVSPTDLTTFTGAIVFVIAVTSIACYIPARRASSLDPLTALRG